MKSPALTIRPALAIFAWWILLFALILVNGYALNLLGLAANSWALLALAGLEAFVFARVLLRQRVRCSGDPLELASFLVVVVGVWLYFVYAAWPTLLPPSISGDAANHHFETEFIFRTGQIFGDYPGGPSLITATLAHWVGWSPLRFEHPTAALWIALTAGAVYGIACSMLPDRRMSKVIALFAPFALFVPWYYFAGTLIRYQYFSPQVAGQLFWIAFIWFLIEYRATRHSLWTFGMALSLIGIGVTFQLWLPLPLALFVLLLAADAVAAHRSILASDSLRPMLVVAGLPALFWLAIVIAGSRFIPELSRFQTIGAVGVPAFETLGGAFLLLPALGVVLAFRSRYRTGTALALAALIALQTGAILAGNLWLHLAEYWVGKAFFLAIFPIALFTVVPIAYAYEIAQQYVDRLHPALALGLTAIILSALVWAVFPPLRYSPLSEAEIQAALWARDHLPSRHINYIGRKSLTAQWLGEGMWGERYPDDLFVDLAVLGPKTFEEWRNDAEWGEYLFVSDQQHLPIDDAMQTVYRFGDAAIMRRPEAAPRAVEGAALGSFGDVFALKEYQILRQTLRAGETISLTARLATVRPPAHQVVWRFQLRDGQGDAAADVRQDPFDNKFPLHRWPDEILLSQKLNLALPMTVSPGVYNLQLGLYYVGNGEPVRYRSTDGTTDDLMSLGRVKVALPAPEKQELDQLTRTDARFGDAFALLGYRVHDDSPLVPGASLRIDLYWQCTQPVGKDYTVFVHLLDEKRAVRAQRDAVPRDGTYPTRSWEKGEIVTDSYSLMMPRDLAPGEYRLAVGMYEWPSLQRLTVDETGRQQPDDQLVLPTTVRITEAR